MTPKQVNTARRDIRIRARCRGHYAPVDGGTQGLVERCDHGTNVPFAPHRDPQEEPGKPDVGNLFIRARVVGEERARAEEQLFRSEARRLVDANELGIVENAQTLQRIALQREPDAFRGLSGSASRRNGCGAMQAR